MNDNLPYQLILLVGMPRSGTTWLGKIFDSHPNVDYRHEPDSERRMDEIPPVVEAQDYGLYEPQVEAYLRDLPRLRSLKILGKAPIFAKSYLSKPGLMMYRANLFIARLGDTLGWRLPIVHPLRNRRPHDVTLAWKSIESAARIGLILKAAPRSRAVLILRHPCAQIASVLHGESTGRFTESEATSEDLNYLGLFMNTRCAREHDLTLGKLAAMHPIARLAWRWVLVYESAIDQVTGNERVKIVRYTDLCRNPLECSKDMFEFCGLDWHPATEDFVKSSTESDKRTYYSVFKIPKIAANKWRESLSQEDIDRILSVLARSKLAAYYPGLVQEPCAAGLETRETNEWLIKDDDVRDPV